MTSKHSMKRIDCLRVLADLAGDALVVSGAGANTVEWNACRPSDGNFRVRTMGLVSSIALGMALGLPKRQVIAPVEALPDEVESETSAGGL